MRSLLTTAALAGGAFLAVEAGATPQKVLPASPGPQAQPRVLMAPALSPPSFQPPESRFPMVIVQKDLGQFPIAVAAHDPRDYSIRLVMPNERRGPRLPSIPPNVLIMPARPRFDRR